MTIYQFTIKRAGFNESQQVYAESITNALAQILATTDQADILKIEKVQIMKNDNDNLLLLDTWQTTIRGTNRQEYEIYLACADDGTGKSITDGKPLKTYEEWINS